MTCCRNCFALRVESWLWYRIDHSRPDQMMSVCKCTDTKPCERLLQSVGLFCQNYGQTFYVFPILHILPSSKVFIVLQQNHRPALHRNKAMK